MIFPKMRDTQFAWMYARVLTNRQLSNSCRLEKARRRRVRVRDTLLSGAKQSRN